jgi:hypothetical protein
MGPSSLAVRRRVFAPAGESLWCPPNFASRSERTPASRSSVGPEESNQRRGPNVHVRRGMQQHPTRCVHLLAALSRNAAPSVHGRRDWSARSTLDDQAEFRTVACEAWARAPAISTSTSAGTSTSTGTGTGTGIRTRTSTPRHRHWRRAPALPPRFVFSECSVVLVPTPVHGWGSITAQCRQQVTTPCRMRWHAPAYMDVRPSFLVTSFWANRKK